MTEIRYSVPVDGTRQEASYTADEVSDDRVAHSPQVALAYARWHAAETFCDGGVDADDIHRVNFADVRIEQMGDSLGGPHG